MTTSINCNEQIKLTEEQTAAIIALGGNTIVGDMIDDNFLMNENECKAFHIYNSATYICTVNRNIEVL